MSINGDDDAEDGTYLSTIVLLVVAAIDAKRGRTRGIFQYTIRDVQEQVLSGITIKWMQLIGHKLWICV